MMTRKRLILLVLGAIALVIAGYFGTHAAKAWWAWRGIERVAFDLADARDRLFGLVGSDAESEEFDTVLVIGSDERPGDEEGDGQDAHADAVLLWLVPTNGEDPVLASLPRDLLLVDPCTGEETKLGRTLTECGNGVSGPEHVALAVESFTGISVDHFATFELAAFADVIDALGGVEICVDYALRSESHGEWVDLVPAGCSTVVGWRALRWIRSRDTQEFVDGEWRFVEGVSDQHRVERQQILMLTLLAELKTMRSPAALTGIAGSLGDTFALDDGLSMTDAVSMIWDLRTVSGSSIRRIVVPTEPVVTTDGSFALRATVPFREILGG